MNKYTIGVDIGGTNTDAVLVDCNDTIIKAVKTLTTEDICSGFSKAVAQLLTDTATEAKQVSNLFLGTTHATNALLQMKDLFRVGVIRIAGQRPDSLPPAWGWPKDMKELIIGGVETIDGGFECHGGILTGFSETQARMAIENLLAKGVDSIAITGVFAPLNGHQEKTVGGYVRERAGARFPLSLSHEIGGIGFIERENSTILNAALQSVMEKGFSSLDTAARTLGFTCPLMITQNDGSVIAIKHAIDYPVLTISAGPTNSFVGGARLAKLDNCVVVDIGGTSTDVGLVRRGFPLRSLNRSTIGGISLNFPMPDVLSIALGGGSIINLDPLSIGPRSVGKALMSEALSFGGNTFTLTDAAIAMGQMVWKPSDSRAVPLDLKMGEAIFDNAKKRIFELIRKMQGDGNDSVVFVGGGSRALPLENRPPYFDVANAYGAALAKISGCIDTLVSLNERERVLQTLIEKAQQKAIDQGADPATLQLVDQQIIPYSYIPNQIARVITRVCGDKK